MNRPASNHRVSIAESGAFVESFSLAPTAPGPLAPLKFAVKDLIDVAGHPTGCGNPTWHKTHGPAPLHAVAVEQLLAAGAECVGKTVTDELAFSLIGENHFFGTPLNPAAPTRVPGGSSSGSASAVACGLADFALGTDTGGSVRVPASNCGVWGLRPSHDRISLAGVMPFAPSFDTVGVLASSGRILENVASVLLAEVPASASEPERILLVADAFELVDADVRSALQPSVERLRARWGRRVETIGIEALTGRRGREGFDHLWDTFCVLQWAEIGSSLGAWIAAARPEFGPATARNFELVQSLDRRRIGAATAARDEICRRLANLVGLRDLVCIPTVPGSAPEKGVAQDRTGDWYGRALALTAIAGLGRLPQVVVPGARTPASPVGLSFLGPWGQDMQVIAAANRFIEGSPISPGSPYGSSYAGASHGAAGATPLARNSASDNAASNDAARRVALAQRPARAIPWRLIGAAGLLMTAVVLLGLVVSWLNGPSELSRPIIDDQGNLIRR